MTKKIRRHINVKSVSDVSVLGHITKDQLLKDAESYDINNYNPLENLSEKEILVPDNRTETISIRLTPQENELIKKYARDNGLSKSAFLRMLIVRSLKI
jgi:predicted DNA binding CopG/RHH family protein